MRWGVGTAVGVGGGGRREALDPDVEEVFARGEARNREAEETGLVDEGVRAPARDGDRPDPGDQATDVTDGLRRSVVYAHPRRVMNPEKDVAAVETDVGVVRSVA